MSAWQGKFVIGLTGNIGTGKSVVRKMLERLGAAGIDADDLAKNAILKGTAGYAMVLQEFGIGIVGTDEEIDRSRLGNIVFLDRNALAKLETIIHPIVREEISQRIGSSRSDVIVIEAIKLIESGLFTACDEIWVTYTPKKLQLARLKQKRGMNAADVLHRIQSQSPQATKMRQADRVIRNDGSLDKTWQQVTAAWLELFPQSQRSVPTMPDKNTFYDMD